MKEVLIIGHPFLDEVKCDGDEEKEEAGVVVEGEDVKNVYARGW